MYIINTKFQFLCRVLLLKDRITLDRRRLEDAHMIYAVLRVLSWYPAKFGPEQKVFRPSCFNKILRHITPKFHQCFSERHAGTAVCQLIICICYGCVGHKCDAQGCNSVLVIDGNLKNHRDICLAKEAGYIPRSPWQS